MAHNINIIALSCVMRLAPSCKQREVEQGGRHGLSGTALSGESEEVSAYVHIMNLNSNRKYMYIKMHPTIVYNMT